MAVQLPSRSSSGPWPTRSACRSPTLTSSRISDFYEAELHRLQGELLLVGRATNEPRAEKCFREALEIARRQEAKSLELRAASSLAHLWIRQGRRAEAYDLLAPVYGWFTKGFERADLKEAKALLDELA